MTLVLFQTQALTLRKKGEDGGSEDDGPIKEASKVVAAQDNGAREVTASDMTMMSGMITGDRIAVHTARVG